MSFIQDCREWLRLLISGGTRNDHKEEFMQKSIAWAAGLILAGGAAAPAASFINDGKAGDWQAVEPVVTFPAGNQSATCDDFGMQRISVADDSRHLYFFFETRPSIADCFSGSGRTCGLGEIFIDADNNPDTGDRGEQRYNYSRSPGYDYNLKLVIGQFFDFGGKPEPYVEYSLKSVRKDGTFEPFGSGESTRKSSKQIAFGPDGVELAIALRDLQLAPGATIRLRFEDDARMYEEEGQSELLYRIGSGLLAAPPAPTAVEPAAPPAPASTPSADEPPELNAAVPPPYVSLKARFESQQERINQSPASETVKKRQRHQLAIRYSEALGRLYHRLKAEGARDEAALVLAENNRLRSAYEPAGASSPAQPSAAPGAPLDITVEKDSGWSLVKTAAGQACYSDRNYVLTEIPPELEDTRLLLRPKDEDRAWLASGRVSVSRACHLHVAIMRMYNGQEVVSDREFERLADDGWEFVSDGFQTSLSNTGAWRVYRKTVERGSVRLRNTSQLPGKTLLFMFN